MTPPIILIAPHHFPDLDRERALAADLGASIVTSENQEEFSARVADADVVMVTPYVRVDADDIGRMKSTAAIVRYGIGYNNIDVPAAVERGIPVSIVPDSSSSEVASHAYAMGLALLRRLTMGDASIRSNGWAAMIAYDARPYDQVTVGIVGYGRIGRITADLYRAIGARTVIYDPFLQDATIDAVELAELLKISDIVSLHLPLSDDTYHLIGARELEQMQAHAVIVNVSRGGLIDEQALAAALEKGDIAGAGLDSFEVEPLPEDHVLRHVKNTILTPHIAWRSTVSGGALQDAAVLRARKALTGEVMPDLVQR